jgi:hypothetical protein
MSAFLTTQRLLIGPRGRARASASVSFSSVKAAGSVVTAANTISYAPSFAAPVLAVPVSTT